MVGKLNYLAQTTGPDILYAVHQVAKYSSCPKQEHGEAVLYIVRYLKRTRDVGLKFKPDPSKGFEDYCVTLQAIGIVNLQRLTQALQNLEAVGLCFMLDAL